MGIEGLLIHDLHRSAVRNLRKAGIAEGVAMKNSGHKGRTVFERYNVVGHEDVLDARRSCNGRSRLLNWLVRSHQHVAVVVGEWWEFQK